MGRVVVVDSTALDTLGSPEWRKALFDAGYELVVVPTAVLAERYIDARREHAIHVALKRTMRVPLGEHSARAAGALRHKSLQGKTRSGRGPSAVDAIVAQAADTAASRDEVLVLTGDPSDLTALVGHAANAARIAVRRP